MIPVSKKCTYGKKKALCKFMLTAMHTLVQPIHTDGWNKFLSLLKKLSCRKEMKIKIFALLSTRTGSRDLNGR